jgi:hypothetical protein
MHGTVQSGDGQIPPEGNSFQSIPLQKKEAPQGRLSGSGAWIRTRDLRVMSSNPVSVPSDRQTVQLS